MAISSPIKCKCSHSRPGAEVLLIRIGRITVGEYRHLLGFLDQAELDRTRSLRSRQSALAYIVGRYAIKWLVALRLGVSPLDVQVSRSAHGKPVVRHAAAEVSLSHTHDWVAVLASEREAVGIDLERAVEPATESAVRAAFHPQELARFYALQGPDDRRSFILKVWTRKEALLKAAGYGFRIDPRTVLVGEDSPVVRATVAGVSHCWRLHTFRPVPDLVCSIAREAPVPQEGDFDAVPRVRITRLKDALSASR